MKKPSDITNQACCDTGLECCDNNQTNPGSNVAKRFDLRSVWGPAVSLFLFLTGLALDYLIQSPLFTDPVRFIWYIIAYLPVGLPVLQQAFTHLRKGDVFTEFFLMGIATIGAFLIGEYPEGVAVMLFYSIGEAFQQNAVRRARENIRALLDVRPKTAHVKRVNTVDTVHPRSVQIHEIIQVLPGERIPLDGTMLTLRAAFDTSAITGESVPRHFKKGQKVLAGMINLDRVIEVETSNSYENSSISRILELVQNAASKKAKTELFIRSFARIYTPAVVLLASLLVVVPYIFVSSYVFQDWLYRGLVFLVISCPCALVLSIPLGYFGGIGAASRNGILVKGSNFLDALKSINTVVFDKTGTLTKGTFSVQKIQIMHSNEDELLSLIHAIEKRSTHPIARAILETIGDRTNSLPAIQMQTEIPGHGIHAIAENRDVLIGNQKLMEKERIQVQMNGYPVGEADSVVHIAVDGNYKGYIIISDELKEDSVKTIEKLRKLGIKQTIMLSGDKHSVGRQIAGELDMDYVFTELLPEEKARKFGELKKEFPGTIAYVGDGINDAPVLALSDVGIAMGAMGSDVAVETADVVIQTDQPSKILTAIKIGKATQRIVWQNISLAMGIKILFLSLGAIGVATLWEAVFADVGVALLAILNAVRIQKMSFS